MLDVGIDAGFSDLAFLAHTSPEGRQAKESEAAFNASVDLLSSAVRDIQSRIIAGGASHISRLEAKGTADRVAQRLDSAVRTELVRGKRLVCGEGRAGAVGAKVLGGPSWKNGLVRRQRVMVVMTTA